MNRKHKAYLKINIITLFFIALSSISVTLAWFAYSGLADVTTEIDIKSWLIEFEKNDTTVSNDIVISLDDIYPGMRTMHESIKIKNRGDSNAKLSYSITSARILDDELIVDGISQDELKDALSHDYPFNININLSDNFVLSGGDESELELSISWPLDSNNDEFDSMWGNKAYQFGNNEQLKQKDNPTYQIRPSIKIIISAKAVQLIETKEASDINYPFGKLILYDVINNTRCTQLVGSCIRTHIIDEDNKICDKNVTLLADLYGNYSTGVYEDYDEIYVDSVSGWNVVSRPLEFNDVLNIISKDISNTLIKREGLSDAVLGFVKDEDRIDNIISNTVLYNGYYSFLNEKYKYLETAKCYWLNREYNETKGFALTKIDDVTSKVYGEEKVNSCSVVPVITVSKEKLGDILNSVCDTE